MVEDFICWSSDFLIKNRVRQKFWVDKAGLVLLETCNFWCKHCYNSGSNLNIIDSNLSINQWLDVILSLRKLGCMYERYKNL